MIYTGFTNLYSLITLCKHPKIDRDHHSDHHSKVKIRLSEYGGQHHYEWIKVQSHTNTIFVLIELLCGNLVFAQYISRSLIVLFQLQTSHNT